jgi:hypothetical protein
MGEVIDYGYLPSCSLGYTRGSYLTAETPIALYQSLRSPLQYEAQHNVCAAMP